MGRDERHETQGFHVSDSMLSPNNKGTPDKERAEDSDTRNTSMRLSPIYLHLQNHPQQLTSFRLQSQLLSFLPASLPWP